MYLAHALNNKRTNQYYIIKSNNILLVGWAGLDWATDWGLKLSKNNVFG